MLDSWRDGPTKSSIVDFVHGVTAGVPVEERIAVFDNDGTLWCEKPAYVQLDFIVRRLADKAADDPGLRSQQPYRAAVEQDLSWFGAAVTKHYRGDDDDLNLLARAGLQLHMSMSVDEYAGHVTDFFSHADHPTFGRPYRACTYAPMVELLGYLADNDFTCYIVSGGGRDFIRPVAQAIYGIPPERVIGSAQGLKLDYSGDLLIQPTLDVFDDGPEKPVQIWSRIGRRPLLAAGNSNGDDEMLRYCRGLRLLVDHDDADREFAYSAGAERALEHAGAQGWTVISMRRDWTTIFDA
ncbi:acid phosphatase [Mycolicibacterium arabiense]|uniref:Acid phosphatase n=1 Tax=Mycolicibacterium arabiense TaxID=1286181 RepID=A0A7I7S0R1_9MYCO|nr:HAD family hydrolase [Mycolicibacterium arabiense]MCV7371586.1 haloacid dehalogenase-like hydrolase [Mycolicibacterium arabiense]BBY50293.1 acid phosphatase [Mycolicibacterium arabiense]